MAWSQLELSDSHIAYACVGVFSTIFSLVSLFVKERLYIGEATVATIAGLIFGPHCLNWFNPLSWGESEVITLEISRIVLCVQIVAVAVELPKKYMKKHWLSVAIFLLPVMTAGWLIVGLFIWCLIPNFNFAEALLVSACVTATDPVLAAAVVGKGKFAERVPGHLRNLLSAESGCNDGMAFPFIFLSLNILIHPGHAGEIVKDWILITVLYQCVFGIVLGTVIGYTLRKLVAYAEKRNTIDRESFLAFFIFLAFNSAGFGSILGVDDLLVSFAAGSAFGWNGDFAKKTEESHVSTVIDLIINLAFFVYFGAIVPWQEFNNTELGLNVWRLIILALVIIFLRRLPAVVALKPITPDVKSWREAIFCGHFGPIGVGAIFAAILARRDLEEHYLHDSSNLDNVVPEEKEYHQLLNSIWPIVNFVVITSIVVHGSSVAVLTLGKRLNRMAITMTFTNTTGNESSSHWLTRLQKLEKTNTSFSLHRVDSDGATLRPSVNGSNDDFKRHDAVETSGIKYRPAGGATRKKKGKRRRRISRRRSNLIKTLSRSHTHDAAEENDTPEHLRQRPPSQILQLGKTNEPQDDELTDHNREEYEAKIDDSPPSGPSQTQTQTASEENSDIKGTAYQEGNKIVIEDDNGEVIEDVPLAKKDFPSPNGSEERSIHSMDSLRRHLTQYSSAEESTRDAEASPNFDQGHLLRLPSIATTLSGYSRKAYYKKNDPNQRKVYAHQIDDVLLIENEDGEIIRKYKVNKHYGENKTRVRSDSMVNKALSFVGLRKKAQEQPPDLEKLSEVITPEYIADAPELESRGAEQQIESHLTDLIGNKGKLSTAISLPTMAEGGNTEEESEEVDSEEIDSEEEEEVDEGLSEDSEFENSDTEEDLEETEVERKRRLAALGQLPATRDAEDEEE